MDPTYTSMEDETISNIDPVETGLSTPPGVSDLIEEAQPSLPAIAPQIPKPPPPTIETPLIKPSSINLGSEFDIVQPTILPPQEILAKITPFPTITLHGNNEEKISQKPIFHEQQKSDNSPVFLALGLFLLLLFISITAFLAAIAYGSINIGSAESQKTIERLVLGLPFVPKTPSYVLESSILAHQKITSQSFDLSLAAKGDDPVSNLGLTQFDANLKGKIDYSDQNNVRASLALQITKDFNAEIRKNDKFVYFKLNKLPQMLYSFLSLKESKIQPILDNWISLDTTPLNTEARKRLSEVSEENGSAGEITTNAISKFASDEVLKKIKLTEETKNKTEVFKLHFAPDDKTLDTIGKKVAEETIKEAKKNNPDSLAKIEDYKNISTYLKNLVVDFYVGKKDYFLREIGVNFDIINSKDAAGTYSSFVPDLSSKYTVSMVLTMDDFGKPIAIELPAKSITTDEAMKLVQLAIAPESDTNNPDTLPNIEDNRLLKKQTTVSDLNISSAKAVITPSSSIICPTSFKISGTINGLGTGPVTYRWVRSDGIKTPYETIDLSKNNTVTVEAEPWKLNESYTGWVTLETIIPNKITSAKATLSLKCNK